MVQTSIPFRQKHLLQLLEGYDQQSAPIDFWVSRYFREHSQLGSKDRAYISEEVYRLVRYRALCDHFLQRPTWYARFNWLSDHDPKAFVEREEIPLHIRVSMPEVLFQELVATWGQEKAKMIALSCLEPAPTCIRTNRLKVGRDQLLQRLLEQGYQVVKGDESEDAIYFQKKVNFFVLPEFKEGLFEVQDEASQLVAQMVQAKPQELILDFCAGSGGKTLAIAPSLNGTGQIFLHDVRLHALLEAKKRLKRAGIQNAQIVASDDEKRLKQLKKRMDWVLVDAPCSGSGTLRRNPDMKWKFSNEMLDRLVASQRVIFEKALSFVKPSGHIVYATCSIFNRENRAQVAHFLQTYPLEQVGDCFESVPESGKKDGFFAVTFRRLAT